MAKRTVFIILFVAVAFAGGVYIGYMSRNTTEGNRQSFQAGWDAARERLEESNMFPLLGEIIILNGIIKTADKQKVTFTTNLLNPLDDEKLKERTAVINEETEMIIRKPRSEQEIREEQEKNDILIKDLQNQLNSTNDENKKMELQAQINTLMMPMAGYFKESEATVNDLKPNYNITIEAAEDISRKQEFTAKKIIVEENVLMPMPDLGAQEAIDPLFPTLPTGR